MLSQICLVDPHLVANKNAKVQQLGVATTSRHEGDGIVGHIHRESLGI